MQTYESTPAAGGQCIGNASGGGLLVSASGFTVDLIGVGGVFRIAISLSGTQALQIPVPRPGVHWTAVVEIRSIQFRQSSMSAKLSLQHC